MLVVGKPYKYADRVIQAITGVPLTISTTVNLLEDFNL